MLNVQLRRPGEGLPFLLTALNEHPEVSDYWLGYLEALLQTGQKDAARETLSLARQHGLSGRAVEEFAARLSPDAPPPSAAPKQTAALTPSAGPLPARKKTAAHKPTLDERGQWKALQAAIARKHFADALVIARSFTSRFPRSGPGWKTLGALLWWTDCHAEALIPMQNAARLLPRDAETHSNLGMALMHAKRPDEAVKDFERALQIDGNLAGAHYNLGMARLQQGRYREAQTSLVTAVSLKPGYLTAAGDLCHSVLLFLYGHDAVMDAASLFAEHCRFGRHIEDNQIAIHHPRPGITDANRCLRVGIVSGDLRDHAVAGFIEPILERLRKNADMELSAYYNETVEDHVTARLRAHFKGWRSVAGLSDASLAALIKGDGIDILIDLSGHTGLNRLHALARKPAPIQVSWMGYPGTTGLRAMDYYLCDRHWLPPAQFERQFVEKLVFLPASAPFQPEAAAPPVNSLPALVNGRITFGSFNRLGKINSATVNLWSRLLRAVPESRMLLAGIPLDGQPTLKLIEQFAAEGVARERLTFHPRTAIDAYLALHHQVDLCLDTFPYTGGTTTLHALWMGVPTLTVAGATPAARQGAAILGQTGLDAFVAIDADDFLVKGVHWAADPAALAELRAGLRERCRQSLYLQPDIIADGLTRALRHMWQRWCAGLPPDSFDARGT